MTSTEIERKFLVKNVNFFDLSTSSIKIQQGYLNSNKDRAVRIRITDNKGYITIKGKSDNEGLSRFEWEKEIPIDEAAQLFKLCESGAITKTRYIIPFKGFIYEVDVFEGDNKGLIIAEVELNSTNDTPELPNWILKEVTEDNRYYNSQLSKNPYKIWK